MWPQVKPCVMYPSNYDSACGRLIAVQPIATTASSQQPSSKPVTQPVPSPAASGTKKGAKSLRDPICTEAEQFITLAGLPPPSALNTPATTPSASSSVAPSAAAQAVPSSAPQFSSLSQDAAATTPAHQTVPHSAQLLPAQSTSPQHTTSSALPTSSSSSSVSRVTLDWRNRASGPRSLPVILQGAAPRI